MFGSGRLHANNCVELFARILSAGHDRSTFCFFFFFHVRNIPYIRIFLYQYEFGKSEFVQTDCIRILKILIICNYFFFSRIKIDYYIVILILNIANLKLISQYSDIFECYNESGCSLFLVDFCLYSECYIIFDSLSIGINFL